VVDTQAGEAARTANESSDYRGPSGMKTPSRQHNLRHVPRRAAGSRGFTLIEAALTTVIIGVGVLAIVAAQQAYHQKNQWSQRVGTGLLLANELRELILTLPIHDPLYGAGNLGPEPGETGIAHYDDVDDFAGNVTGEFGTGTTFSPPVNALRQVIPDMTGWSQHVEVINVLPDRMDVTAAFAQPLGTTDLMRITVTTRFQGPNDPQPVTIAQLTWVMGRQ
jgi:type II secretory pathway pseudopilin PulG